MKKTLEELWLGSPTRKIQDKDYQNLIEYINTNNLPFTIRELSYEIPHLWEMNCDEALEAIKKWVLKIDKREPGYIDEKRKTDIDNLLK